MRPVPWVLLRRLTSVVLLAVSAGVVVFALGQWLMPPALRWAERHATFPGALDLLGNVREFGPAGLASLVIAGVVAAGRGWAGAASGSLDPRARQVVFGAIPQPAWHFQPRPVEEAALRQALESGRAHAALVALPGGRGVGKTQLAAAFARRCVEANYALVAWINAEGGPGTGLAELVKELGLTDAETLTPDLLAAQVRSLLSRRDGAKRLVVFDNVEDPSQVMAFLPAIGKAKVIITTNRQEFATMAGITSIQVQPLEPDQGRAFLAAATKLGDHEAAYDLGQELGWLPLGLSQAASYIVRNKVTYREFLDALSRLSLGETLTQHSGADHPGLLKAVAMTLAGLKQDDPSGLATRLMYMLCVMSPDGVHRHLLTSDAAHGVLGADQTSIATALRTLTDASLASISSGYEASSTRQTAVVTVHRLTARAVRHLVAPLELLEVQRTAQQLLTAARPEGDVRDPDAWGRFRMLWPHVDACGLADSADESARQLAIDSVRYQWSIGDLHSAQARGKQIAGAWSATLAIPMGEPDRHVRQRQLLQLQCNVAVTLMYLGQFQASRKLGEQTLARQRELLGIHHEDTLMTSTGLGGCLRGLGLYREALDLDQQTYTAWLDNFGADHPRTLTALNNLAASYRLIGDFTAALEHDEQVYERHRNIGRQGKFGVLFTASNIGRDLRDAGDYPKSIAILRQVLHDAIQEQGNDSQYTLLAQTNLAQSLYAGGFIGEALRLHKATYEVFKERFGLQNPSTIRCWTSLAITRLAYGDTKTATQDFRSLLNICRGELGERHPITLACINNLAVAERANRSFAAAHLLAQTASDQLTTTLGETHPHTLYANLNHAICVSDSHDSVRATRLLANTIQHAIATFGSEHPDTILAQINLHLVQQARDAIRLDSPLDALIQNLIPRLGEIHPSVKRAKRRTPAVWTIDPHPF